MNLERQYGEMRRVFSMLLFFMFTAVVESAHAQSGYVDGKNYAERAANTCRMCAEMVPSRIEPKDAMPIYTAKIQTGTDVEATFQAVDKMMDAVLINQDTRALDPFFLHAIVHGYCVCKEQWPAPLVAKFRAFAARYDFTKGPGVSLNYELMRDGGGWLAAQEWPDLVDAAGNDEKKIQALCGGRLMKTLAETTSGNASEYGAPLYYGTDFMALRMLAEFALEPKLRQAAQMTLEWMLIQTAAYWNHGYYITSAARAKYWGSNDVSPDGPGATTGMAWLFFGGERAARIASVPMCYWLAHPGHALPCDWLPAWQSALPDDRTVLGTYVRGKRTVSMQSWMTKGYGLASERSDGTPETDYHYKELRRTMLKWVSDKPCSSFAVLQENRRRPGEKIANAFGYGENPYAQVMQSEGTLIGAYDVPAEYEFWKMRAPFTRDGAIVLRKERDGWIFCHGGSLLFAFRSLRPARWFEPDAREHLDLYGCDDPRNGWILETARVTAFAGGGVESELDRFADAVAGKTKIGGSIDASPPRVVFKNLSGHTLDLLWHAPSESYAGQCRLDEKTVEYADYPLLGAPGAMQQPGGALVLTLPGGGQRIYDFKKWTISKP